MSIFGSILSKIFQHHDAEAAPASPPASPQTTPGAAPESNGRPPISQKEEGRPETTADNQGGAAPSASGTEQQTSGKTVDVAAVLDGLAAKNSQKLDWRHSIVDMMKLLDLDSGLAARKSLAQELHYSGSTDDTASMNMWLHGQVMRKLAENGGQVPADLRS